MRIRNVAPRTLHHASTSRFGEHHRERAESRRVHGARCQPVTGRYVRPRFFPCDLPFLGSLTAGDTIEIAQTAAKPREHACRLVSLPDLVERLSHPWRVFCGHHVQCASSWISRRPPVRRSHLWLWRNSSLTHSFRAGTLTLICPLRISSSEISQTSRWVRL